MMETLSDIKFDITNTNEPMLRDMWKIGNESIAKFIGCELYYKGDKYIDTLPPLGYAKLHPDFIEYHSRLDWILPAISKIENMGYSVIIANNTCTIQKYSNEHHTDILLEYPSEEFPNGDKVLNTWLAVCDFIKRYFNGEIDTLIAFELTMPKVSSWNNKWSDADNSHYIFRYCNKKTKDELLQGESHRNFSYDFGDGWVANVEMFPINLDDRVAIEVVNKGFNGYDWMVDSILKNGNIVTK